MPQVKIAVSIMVDETPIWNLALETNQKASRRLGLEEYTKVVRSAEAELSRQIKFVEEQSTKTPTTKKHKS